MSVMTDLDLATNIAASPSLAYAELRQRPRIWFPLLLLTLGSALMFWLYYRSVDVEWLKDTMFGNNADFQAMPEEARAIALKAMTRNTLMISSIAGSMLGLPLVMLIPALYFLIVSKINRLGIQFSHWYSFSFWSSLPLALGYLAGIVMVLMSDNNAQMTPDALEPLSLNQLYFHRAAGQPGQALFASISAFSIWSTVLTIIGLKVWTQRTWNFCCVVALLPSVLIYGIWALVAFK
jgi:hypothetical protein